MIVVGLLAGASLLYAQNGEEQYNKNCKKCHGEDGTGHTFTGKMVKAADLTSSATGQKSDAELAAVISKGKGKMAGFGDKLGGDPGVASVMRYVRSLRK
jgi:mono/diheme cytochrome c family protein